MSDKPVIYIIVQRDHDEDPIMGVYTTRGEAQKCVDAGESVGLDRYIDMYVLEQSYEPSEDYAVVERIEEGGPLTIAQAAGRSLYPDSTTEE